MWADHDGLFARAKRTQLPADVILRGGRWLECDCATTATEKGQSEHVTTTVEIDRVDCCENCR